MIRLVYVFCLSVSTVSLCLPIHLSNALYLFVSLSVSLCVSICLNRACVTAGVYVHEYSRRSTHVHFCFAFCRLTSCSLIMGLFLAFLLRILLLFCRTSSASFETPRKEGATRREESSSILDLRQLGNRYRDQVNERHSKYHPSSRPEGERGGVVTQYIYLHACNVCRWLLPGPRLSLLATLLETGDSCSLPTTSLSCLLVFFSLEQGGEGGEEGEQ